MGELRILPFLRHAPAQAMSIDESLLLASIRKQSKLPVLRLYQFSERCITIGLSQRNSDFLTMVDDMHLNWVRRPTGGGMVLHENDLIFALVAPITYHECFSRAKESYKALHEAVGFALQKIGVETSLHQGGCKAENIDPQLMICFERPICDDLMSGKRKLVGGAQRRSEGYLLHQGAIHLKSGKEKEAQDLIQALPEALLNYFSWSARPDSFESLENDLAKKLETEKYSSTDWNWKVRVTNVSGELIPHL